MFPEKIEKAFNEHLNAELYSAYLYFAMSSWFKTQNLEGCAGWMHVQGLEEMSHAKKFYDYIDERDGRVLLTQIDAPPVEWDSPLHAFEETLKHEYEVTRRIHSLVDLCNEEKDHAGIIFLQWFVTEQVEEEASVKKVIDQINLLKDAPGGIYMLDKELGSRDETAVFASLMGAPQA